MTIRRLGSENARSHAAVGVREIGVFWMTASMTLAMLAFMHDQGSGTGVTGSGAIERRAPLRKQP